MTQQLTKRIPAGVSDLADPVLERALLFADWEWPELTRRIPQRTPTGPLPALRQAR